MISATITEIQGRDNCYSALLGVLGPSPSHGEVQGRLFCLVGNRIIEICDRTGRPHSA
jgi:hypothetical protein